MTYALTLDTGKITYISALSARQARIVWGRANNEKIVSIHVCKEYPIATHEDRMNSIVEIGS